MIGSAQTRLPDYQLVPPIAYSQDGQWPLGNTAPVISLRRKRANTRCHTLPLPHISVDENIIDTATDPAKGLKQCRRSYLWEIVSVMTGCTQIWYNRYQMRQF